MNLRSHKGSILIYVLVFFNFFLGWFHFKLQSIFDVYEEEIYLKQIDEHLKIEVEAINHLKSQGPQNVTSLSFNQHSIEYECEKEFCIIYIRGDINYSFIYDIIDE